MEEFLIRGGRLVTPAGVVASDLLIRDGCIAAIGPDLETDPQKTLELNGEIVLPGGVDVHVHLPWPTGRFISSDDFDSGTRAAAFGGVTTLIDFVIPADDENLPDAVAKKRGLADGHAWVDYGLHINLRGNVQEHLAHVPELVKAGYPSYKLFMAYEGFRVAVGEMPEIFRRVGEAGGMVNVHAEDGLMADRLTAELVALGRTSLDNYPSARPAEVEIRAVEKILEIQKSDPVRLHLHHISTSHAAEIIGAAREEGRQVSAETCPHYLLFEDNSYRSSPKMAAQLVCAPSIKTAADRLGLWEALEKGWLSMIATDHCPYTLAQKENNLTDFTRTPSGIGGVELRLPLLYSAGVLSDRFSVEKFAELWATNPARCFGLYPRKGVIAVGSDADLVVFDPERKVTIRASDLKMNADCTPYEGNEVTGWPVATFLRGRLVVQNDSLAADHPAGIFIPRHLKNGSC
jgi:dihydropyrimidinase